MDELGERERRAWNVQQRGVPPQVIMERWRVAIASRELPRHRLAPIGAVHEAAKPAVVRAPAVLRGGWREPVGHVLHQRRRQRAQREQEEREPLEPRP